MKAHRPLGSDDEHQVIPFRPRHPPKHARERHQASSQTTAGHSPQLPDDFRARMIANLAAFLFTALLTGIGIWLATAIADLRKAQDCGLIGGQTCQRPISKSG